MNEQKFHTYRLFSVLSVFVWIIIMSPDLESPLGFAAAIVCGWLCIKTELPAFLISLNLLLNLNSQNTQQNSADGGTGAGKLHWRVCLHIYLYPQPCGLNI